MYTVPTMKKQQSDNGHSLMMREGLDEENSVVSIMTEPNLIVFGDTHPLSALVLA